MEILDFMINVIVYGLPIIIAITLHEAAHGYVALSCGDQTALRMGRVTLNPVRHIDPFGTVLLPLMLMLFHAPFLFGYAKPVPVNFNALRNPRLDSMWVALAGPGANFLLALTSGLLLHTLVLFSGAWHTLFKDMFEFSLVFNCLIGLFNLIPILPLDGGRVVASLLPEPLRSWWSSTERFGLLLVLTLIFLLPWALGSIGIQFSPIQYILKNLVFYVQNGILYLTGHI